MLGRRWLHRVLGFRLNGWQRIGIVLSVVWALGAWLFVRDLDVEHAQAIKDVAYKTCTSSPWTKGPGIMASLILTA